MAGNAGADSASHRRSVAPRRRTWLLAPSLATSRTTAHRCTLSRSDSANGRGELSLGRSADPRRIAETRNRHIGTHGLALSARPPATTVTAVAYILRESPRWPYTDLAADVGDDIVIDASAGAGVRIPSGALFLATFRWSQSPESDSRRLLRFSEH